MTFPAIPPDALACLSEPDLPMIETDAQLAVWAEEVRRAGQDCRARIGWLRNLVATWPK